MTDLDKLLAVCRAATPGPWVEDDGNIFSKALCDADHAYIMRLMADKAFHEEQGDDQKDRPEPLVAKCEQDLPNFIADAAWWKRQPLRWRIRQRLWWRFATIWAGITGGLTPGEKYLLSEISRPKPAPDKVGTND